MKMFLVPGLLRKSKISALSKFSKKTVNVYNNFLAPLVSLLSLGSYFNSILLLSPKGL